MSSFSSYVDEECLFDSRSVVGSGVGVGFTFSILKRINTFRMLLDFALSACRVCVGLVLVPSSLLT